MRGRGRNSGRYSIIILALLLLSHVILSPRLSGQTFYFEQYGSKEGLSASKVYTIIQDANEFIWLGTGSGLTRFNGLHFENFSTSDSLSPGGVKSICEDSRGRLWLGHIGGGVSIIEGNIIRRVCFSPSIFIGVDSARIRDPLKPINSLTGDITGITEYGGSIWVSTSRSGVLRLDMPEHGVRVMTGQQYIGRQGLSNDAFGLYADHRENLYCITDVGIRRYDHASDRFIPFHPEGLTRYFLTTTIFEDSRGNMWFGTFNGGLYRQDGVTGEMGLFDTRNGLWGNFVSYILEDYRGNIWVASMEDWESRGGITVISPEGTVVYNNTNGLLAQHILCMIEDKEKNILIADRDAGLFIYKGDHFASFMAPQFMPSNDVFTLAQDHTGSYWFGTGSGLSLYNPALKEDDRVKLWGFPPSLEETQISIIRPDKEGNVWIATAGDEVYRYDNGDKNFRYDLDLNASLRSLRITAMTTDLRNNLWIGTDGALIMWDPQLKKSTKYTRIDGLTGNNITALFCDSRGSLWIGTEEQKGLARLNPGNDTFIPLTFRSDVHPTAITETPDGMIWVGTIDGLYGLSNDTVKKKLTEAEGLLMNSINLLQPDRSGNLFIGTNLGLNRYDSNTGRISSFTEKSGFTGIETRPNASFADDMGDLWFGTSNGAMRLSPSMLPPVVTEPATHIWRTLVNYEVFPMHDGIRLLHTQNRIIFDFLSICLVNPGAVRYQFMLEGADKEWITTDQNRAVYSSLRPGKYIFLVKASNNYGFWNEVPAKLSFSIRGPVYLTSWFIILCITVVVAGVYLYISLRERKLRREKEHLEQKVKERTAEVVSKSHELEEKNRDTTASIRYAERIQAAMLPPENYFNDTFVLFMPRDIVSGDFYWMYDTGYKQYIAAVDCTGHGVPGAFMSIIGHNSLNKIVRESGIEKPSDILDHLNIEVVHALLQRSEKAVRDGMDISVISYDILEHTVEYAGAYQPLYHVRDGKVTVYRGDRFPIGMIDGQARKSFTNNLVDVKSGDMLYIFTDGFADQFGGEHEKKFKTLKIRSLLSEIYMFSVEEQKRRLEKAIREWMGELAQVDDILFIGTRVP